MPFKLQKSYSTRSLQASRLKAYLDPFLQRLDYSRHIQQDPVRFVHSYSDPRDQEIAGLLSSGLAYGRVDQILKFLGKLFEVLGAHPYQYVLNFDPKANSSDFHNLNYRFYRGRDIACFIYLLKQVLGRHSSLENLFLEKYTSGFSEAAQNFVHKILVQDVSPFYRSGKLASNSPVRFFLPSPQDGSTCKRLNLFFRWMVRGPDEVDLGLWTRVSKKDLVIPLDTHVARICRYLGLASLKTVSWKTAFEITQNLKLLDSQDPIKYDFAICHLGISGDCPSRSDPLKCAPCPLRPACLFWNQKMRLRPDPAGI